MSGTLASFRSLDEDFFQNANELRLGEGGPEPPSDAWGCCGCCWCERARCDRCECGGGATAVAVAAPLLEEEDDDASADECDLSLNVLASHVETPPLLLELFCTQTRDAQSVERGARQSPQA